MMATAIVHGLIKDLLFRVSARVKNTT